MKLFLVKTILEDKISVCRLCKNKQLLTKHFMIQSHHGKCKTGLNKEVILLLFMLLSSLISNNELYFIKLKGFH